MRRIEVLLWAVVFLLLANLPLTCCADSKISPAGRDVCEMATVVILFLGCVITSVIIVINHSTKHRFVCRYCGYQIETDY